MPIVNFVNEKKQLQVPQGANLRREALKAGIDLYPGMHKYLNCHGFAQCGSCRVLIAKGQENVSSMGLIEKLRFCVGLVLPLAKIGNEKTLRLSCQTRVNGDIDVVTKPPLNLFGESFFG